MRPVALLTRQWPQPSHDRLNALCETRLLVPGTDIDSAFFRTLNRDVSLLCSSFLDPVDDALLDALPGLALVAHYGRWHAPPAPLRARGLQLTDTGPAGAADAADFALAQLLAATRRLTQPLIESGGARALDQGLAPSLHGMTLGLLGYDRVAAELAARCRALQIRVCCWTADAGDAALADGIVRVDSATALVAQADAISLHARGPVSAPLLDAAVLAACRPHSVVVNVTAATLLDEPALIAALSDYAIGGAALDVCSNDPALAQCPNLLRTAQQATNTAPARTEMAERVVDNIAAWLAGRPMPDAW